MIRTLYRNLSIMILCIGINANIYSMNINQFDSIENWPDELQLKIFRSLLEDAQNVTQLQEYITKYAGISRNFRRIANTTDGQKIVIEMRRQYVLRNAQARLNELLHETGGVLFIIDLIHGGPNAENNQRNTVLHIAAQYPNKFSGGLINQLIAVGADVNRKGNNGLSPLHYAVLSQNLNAMQAFIQNGAHVNAPDVKGDTPLDVALQDDRITTPFTHNKEAYYNTIKILLSNGACISKKLLKFVQNSKIWTNIKTLVNQYKNIQTCTILEENPAKKARHK